MKELNRIELKRELTASLEKEGVAFLNNHDGGLLYLGIDDDGHEVGVADCDAVQLQVKDRLKNNTCKSVLDREEGVGNRVLNRITSRERIDRPFWNPVALREAVINAIIHNDYAAELVQRVE